MGRVHLENKDHRTQNIKGLVKQDSPNNIGSIISVVGKTTIEIIELFECRQKVP